MYGVERMRIGEALFNPAKYYTLPGSSTDTLLGLPEMIHNSLKLCDSELWQGLLASTMLTGGTTLLSGLPDRVNIDVSQLASTVTSYARDSLKSCFLF